MFTRNTKQPVKKNHGQQSDIATGGITWGPWAAVLMVIVVFLVAQIAASFIVILYPHIKGWNATKATNWVNGSIIAQFFYVLFAEAITIALVVWFIRYRKGSFRAIGLKQAKWEDVPYALIAFSIYFVMYIVVVGVLSNVIKSLNVNQVQQLGFGLNTTGWSLVLVFISLVLLPAVTEEFLFRGFLYSAIRKRLTTVWAVIITSVLFASPHLLESANGGLLWIAGIDTFTLSVVLCVLREKTGRLYAGMGVHAIKNTVAFVSLFLLHAR